MEKKSAALFRSRSPAEEIRNRLVQADLDARIAAGSWLHKLWFVPRKAACVTLEVPADELERAAQLLAHWDTAGGELREAVRCPECKSFRVQYPQFARNSILTNVLLGFAAALRLLEKEYYCEDCHYTWPKETQPRRGLLPGE